MPNDLPIPASDAAPIPGPVWLIHFLLVFTFILHVIPMNFTLGGGIVALWAEMTARFRGDERFGRLARTLAQIVPYATAAAITTGIAPLLFVQVLYGQFFYTSSVLIATPWISVILLLIMGYYGLYRNSFRVKAGKPIALWTAWASSLIFVVIGFIYTNNMTLMLTPESWRGLQSAHGNALNLGEPSLIPRYLHFLIGSIAVSGALVAACGLFLLKKDEPHARWLIRVGSFLFIGTTGVQFLVGFAFLFSLRAEWRAMFLGGDPYATGLLMGGMASAVLAMGLMLIAALNARPTAPAVGGMAALLLTISLMAMMRDALRTRALSPHLSPFRTEPQTAAIVLFGVLLVGGLAAVGWMLRALLRAPVPVPSKKDETA